MLDTYNRLAGIPLDELRLLADGKRRSIAYERERIQFSFTRRHNKTVGPESWPTICRTYCRMLRREIRELGEFESEFQRRGVDKHGE